MVIKHVCNISVSQVPVRVVLIKIVEKFSTTSKYYNATGVSNCKSCSTCESFLGEGWDGVGWGGLLVKGFTLLRKLWLYLICNQYQHLAIDRIYCPEVNYQPA